VVSGESGEVGNPGTLGMTKGRAEFPLGIGCWDSRSQERDLGHPSALPFDLLARARAQMHLRFRRLASPLYSKTYVGRHITSRMEFLVLPVLGHHGTSGDGSALSPRLEQNPPYSSANLPGLARVVLSRGPLRSLGSDCLASRHPGRPAAGRPYDTAPDTHVGGAAPPASRSTGPPPITIIAALRTPRWPWPFLPRPILAPDHPPDHPSGICVAGHEYRLHRVACPPSL
jgi:hypothetical protein